MRAGVACTGHPHPHPHPHPHSLPLTLRIGPVRMTKRMRMAIRKAVGLPSYRRHLVSGACGGL